MIAPKLTRILCCLALATPLLAHADTKPCRISNFPQEVQCGEVKRPLDPSKPDGKSIDIHYVVLPSQDRNKLPDAVFLLAGGPGQSAIDVSSMGEMMLAKLNRRRDLVFVDQRGTGKSAPLRCPKIEGTGEMVSKDNMVRLAQSCADELQKLPYGDLRFYSTSIAVQDLEAVRVAQKYSAINVVGASYGTRVGLEYLRQFPKSVRRLVIDGVAPPDLSLLAADAKVALQGIFADCEKSTKCKASYPSLAATWQHLLDSTPRQANFTHPRLGKDVHVNLQREDVISMVFRALYTPSTTSAVPYAISQADQGKFGPLATIGGQFSSPGPAGMSMGMHFSVWCSEAYARPRTKTNNDEFGNAMGDLYDRICEKWPRAEIPNAFFDIPKSDVPVLLLSGGIDPVTPIRNGEQVSKALGEKSKHVTVENLGHGVIMHGCVREVVNGFIAAKDDDAALKVNTECVRQIPRPLAWQAPMPPTASSASSVEKGEQK